ncbi:MAG: CHRD domain-containing protein [Gemmatimonadota bacterium]|nr:MAG: CHRD domain-containing protein [Gemmatimonadota bacterium]
MRSIPTIWTCTAQVVVALTLLLALPGLGSSAVPQASRQQEIDVYEATILELQDAMDAGQTTAAQLVDAYLARIEAYDRSWPNINSIIRVNPNARLEAEALDREREARGPRGLLHGIPIILKDNYDTADMPTTAGSIALAGLIPPDDAFQVRKLREAGAIILAKSNLHELAMGITTISSLGGQTLNPYGLSRNAGGSSGGTGAAIAASFGAIGWGSDTCGSIRIPAAQNNLFGLRPTKGLSSIDGIIPLCHTQDVGGPLARSVTDLAIGLDATIGPDSADSATRALDGLPLPRFVEALDSNAMKGTRLGVLTMLFGDAPEDRESARVVRTALEQMQELGAEIIEIDIPGLDTLLRGSSVIGYEFKFDFIDYLAATPGAPVESLQDILDQHLYHEALESRYQSRNRVQERDSKEYRTAYAKREPIRNAVVMALEDQQLDALVYPTIRRKAAHIGEPQRGSNCQLSAGSGLPALSMPAGFTDDGLPVGLELLGRPFDDASLVALAYSFEQEYQPRRPPLSTPTMVGGKPPAVIYYEAFAEDPDGAAFGRFFYHTTDGRLGYRITISGLFAEQVYSINLHRVTVGDSGPVVHLLGGPGEDSAWGWLNLRFAEREALLSGQLYLSVYTKENPTGAMRATLVIP